MRTMTSQIALLNGAGVAVASDSAATVGQLTYPSANKVYQLAGRQPVGFMSCGLASYRGISIDNVFGQFREYLAGKHGQNKELDKLSDYVGEFKLFLYNFSPASPDSTEATKDPKVATEYERDALEYELRKMMELWFPSLRAHVMYRRMMGRGISSLDVNWYQQVIHREDMLGAAVGIGDIGEVILKGLRPEIEEHHSEILDRLDREKWQVTKRSMSQKYAKIVNPFIDELVKVKGLPKSIITPKLRDIIYHHLDSKSIRHPTEVSIFGFGKKEDLPSLITLRVGAWRPDKDCTDIGQNNAISSSKDHWSPQEGTDGITRSWAFVCTFAQTEEADAVLDGLHWNVMSNLLTDYSDWGFLRTLQRPLFNIKGIGEATRNKIIDELRSERAKKHIKRELKNNIDACNRRNRFCRIVSNLPMDELAEFSETLIHLESAIAYYTREVRSVGGPIDVATITKEDGFIWVKSKQIVDYRLNPRQRMVPRDSANLK